MAQYTTEAFRWSGTGYNAQYNTSYTAVLDDNDAAYQGGSDGDETISINGGSFNSTASTPYAIDVSFTATDSSTHVETFYFFNTGGNWYFTPGPGSAFTVGATLGNYQSHTVGWNYTDVICFTKGTQIVTPTGRTSVENLKVGDLVVTRDNGLQAVRWIGSKRISGARLQAYPHLRPIKIKAHAFGHNVPEHDLLVSPQHKMFLKSKQAQLLFGESEVLVPAKGLVNDHSVVVDYATNHTNYIHILFDRHELVLANGAWSESFHVGEVGLSTVDDAARAELLDIFPELGINQKLYGSTARPTLKVTETGQIQISPI